MFRGPLIELFMLLFSGSVTESQVVSVVLSIFSVLVIIFVVFPIHECAHGLMAKILGDDTAERQGRLTLNPFAHIDVMGAVMMMLFRIGWAKPTPVDIRRCNKVKPRAALALTSLAGPLANILLSYIMIIAYKLVLMNLTSTTGAYIALGLYYTAQINVYLAGIQPCADRSVRRFQHTGELSAGQGGLLHAEESADNLLGILRAAHVRSALRSVRTCLQRYHVAARQGFVLPRVTHGGT